MIQICNSHLFSINAKKLLQGVGGHLKLFKNVLCNIWIAPYVEWDLHIFEVMPQLLKPVVLLFFSKFHFLNFLNNLIYQLISFLGQFYLKLLKYHDLHCFWMILFQDWMHCLRECLHRELTCGRWYVSARKPWRTIKFPLGNLPPVLRI